MQPPANYSTKVPVTRTVSEVQEMLARHGASAVHTEFQDGVPSGLVFSYLRSAEVLAFRLPVAVEEMQKLLVECAQAGVLGSRPENVRRSTAEHARRVAWRVARDWVRAQLTLVDARMAPLHQVFLPYLVTAGGSTVFERYERRQLEA
jgi:hypothetical protein